MFGKKKHEDIETTEDKVSKKELKKLEKRNRKEQKRIDRSREPQVSKSVEEQMIAEGDSPKSKGFKKRKKEKVDARLELRDTFLDRIKPVGNVKFNSMDIMIEGRYARVLTFIVRQGSMTNLPPMWGLDLTPSIRSDVDPDLAKRTSAKMIINVSRRTKQWVNAKIPQAMDVSQEGISESNKAGQAMEALLFREQAETTRKIAQELNQNASYLDLSIRIIVKADNRQDLDDAVRSLERDYTSKFQTSVTLVPFVGQQLQEFKSMTDSAETKIGENYQLTSREMAGSYNFHTRGVNDDDGNYVGYLSGELNNDPVLLNTMHFEDIATIYAEGKAHDVISETSSNIRHPFYATTAWGVQVTHDALIRGNRVMHFVLNNENIVRPSSDFTDMKPITQHFNMSQYDKTINLLEPFNTTNDEFHEFDVQSDKIATIIKQYSQQESSTDDSVLTNADMRNLTALLKGFYMHANMWVSGAKENREHLRFLNIPSDQLPTISEFAVFTGSVLAKSRKEARATGGAMGDTKSIDKLHSIIKSISEQRGDMFDKQTNIDRKSIQRAKQVIFDFDSLGIRSSQSLMAQFVNTFSFAEREIGYGDVIVIHGADTLSPSVAQFLKRRIRQLNDRNIKVVLMYNDSKVMLDGNIPEHKEWFQKATMRISGVMTADSVKMYQKALGITFSSRTAQTLSSTTDRYVYLFNRGRQSILFNHHIVL